MMSYWIYSFSNRRGVACLCVAAFQVLGAEKAKGEMKLLHSSRSDKAENKSTKWSFNKIHTKYHRRSRKRGSVTVLWSPVQAAAPV